MHLIHDFINHVSLSPHNIPVFSNDLITLPFGLSPLSSLECLVRTVPPGRLELNIRTVLAISLLVVGVVVSLDVFPEIL